MVQTRRAGNAPTRRRLSVRSEETTPAAAPPLPPPPPPPSHTPPDYTSRRCSPPTWRSKHLENKRAERRCVWSAITPPPGKNSLRAHCKVAARSEGAVKKYIYIPDFMRRVCRMQKQLRGTLLGSSCSSHPEETQGGSAQSPSQRDFYCVQGSIQAGRPPFAADFHMRRCWCSWIRSSCQARCAEGWSTVKASVRAQAFCVCERKERIRARLEAPFIWCQEADHRLNLGRGVLGKKRPQR